MNVIIERLEGMKIEYVKAVVREGGIIVDQIFFHDPDGHMIEICNCQDLPVLPLTACPIRKTSTPKITIPKTLSFYGNLIAHTLLFCLLMFFSFHREIIN